MTAKGTESTRTILRRLAGNVAAMLETYAGLAGQEARATVRDIAVGAALLGAAAVLGMLVLAMLVVTLVLVLATVMAPWLAALVVLGATVLLMALAVAIGLGRFRRRRLSKLVTAFREDVRWLRSTLLESD